MFWGYLFFLMFKLSLVLIFISTLHIVWSRTEKEKMEIVEIEEVSDDGPAPDIWTWGLISNRYLPSLRCLSRFYSIIIEICFLRKRSRLYLTKEEQTIKVLWYFFVRRKIKVSTNLQFFLYSDYKWKGIKSKWVQNTKTTIREKILPIKGEMFGNIFVCSMIDISSAFSIV